MRPAPGILFRQALSYRRPAALALLIDEEAPSRLPVAEGIDRHSIRQSSSDEATKLVQRCCVCEKMIHQDSSGYSYNYSYMVNLLWSTCRAAWLFHVVTPEQSRVELCQVGSSSWFPPSCVWKACQGDMNSYFQFSSHLITPLTPHTRVSGMTPTERLADRMNGMHISEASCSHAGGESLCPLLL